MFKFLQTLIFGLLASYYAKVPPFIKRKLTKEGNLTAYTKFIIGIENKIISIAGSGNSKLMKKLYPTAYCLFLLLNAPYPAFIVIGFNNCNFKNRVPYTEKFLPAEIEVFDICSFVTRYTELLENTISVSEPLCSIYPVIGEAFSLGISPDYGDMLLEIATIKDPDLARKVTQYMGFDIVS